MHVWACRQPRFFIVATVFSHVLLVQDKCTEEAGERGREMFCLPVSEKWSDLELGEWKGSMQNQWVVQYSMCGKFFEHLKFLSEFWWLPDEMELVPQLCKWTSILRYQGKDFGQPFKKWGISNLFGRTEGGVCRRQLNKPSSGKEPCRFSAC